MDKQMNHLWKALDSYSIWSETRKMPPRKTSPPPQRADVILGGDLFKEEDIKGSFLIRLKMPVVEMNLFKTWVTIRQECADKRHEDTRSPCPWACVDTFGVRLIFRGRYFFTSGQVHKFELHLPPGNAHYLTVLCLQEGREIWTWQELSSEPRGKARDPT